MKLHRAIRLGALLTPEDRSQYYSCNGACAVGGAVYAQLSRREDKDSVHHLLLRGQVLTRAIAMWPGEEKGSLSIRASSLHANRGWSRRRIARYIQSIEDPESYRAWLERRLAAKAQEEPEPVELPEIEPEPEPEPVPELEPEEEVALV